MRANQAPRNCSFSVANNTSHCSSSNGPKSAAGSNISKNDDMSMQLSPYNTVDGGQFLATDVGGDHHYHNSLKAATFCGSIEGSNSVGGSGGQFKNSINNNSVGLVVSKSANSALTTQSSTKGGRSSGGLVNFIRTGGVGIIGGSGGGNTATNSVTSAPMSPSLSSVATSNSEVSFNFVIFLIIRGVISRIFSFLLVFLRI